MAFPLIGTGGGGDQEVSEYMRAELESVEFEDHIKLVRLHRMQADMAASRTPVRYVALQQPGSTLLSETKRILAIYNLCTIGDQ